MTGLRNVMESIVVLDDELAELSSATLLPVTSCMSSLCTVEQSIHITESPFTSAKKERHVLKMENEKLFAEFVEHCTAHTQDHPEVVTFLQTKYSKSSPDFLMSVEFRNALGRCLTRAQANITKTFVYINELCTLLKQHSIKRKALIQPTTNKKHSSKEISNAEGEGNIAVSEASTSRQTDLVEEERNIKRASRRQLAYLENLLKVYNDEIRRLQEKDLSFEELEKDDSCYIQEHKLKRKMMKIYNKLCELKGCSTLTGRVIEQRIVYNSTRYLEINKKIERFINLPEVHQNPPDYSDILKVVRRTNERCQLMLSRKQQAQIAQEAFRETGNKLQERRHLDMVYNFGSHLSDVYKPTLDPALTDVTLAQKLRTNREMALTSLEEVINKYANKQDDTEEEERRKRQEKEKKENGQQEVSEGQVLDKNKDKLEEMEEEEEDSKEEEEEGDLSSEPDIEDEIQASAAQLEPEDEDNEEEQLNDTALKQLTSYRPSQSPKLSSHYDDGGQGDDEVQHDDGQRDDKVQQSVSETYVEVGTEKSLHIEHTTEIPSSPESPSQSGVTKAQSDEDKVASNCILSALSNSFNVVRETSGNSVPTTKKVFASDSLLTPSPGKIDTCSSKKRKCDSEIAHRVIQNGNIRQNSMSNNDVPVTYVGADSTQADTPIIDMVSSSRCTPPPKKNKVNVATQCDPEEVIILSDSD